MLEDTGISEIYAEPGMTGAAYVRDRACEKHTPGWIRRSKARAERRGKPIGKLVSMRGHDLSVLALKCGGHLPAGQAAERPENSPEVAFLILPA